MKKFHTTKQRTVTDIIPYTLEQFQTLLLAEKPKLIFCDPWSQRIPLYVITEYNDSGIVYYCNSASDKTPTQGAIESIYNQLKYGGLAESHIESDKELEDAILKMAPNFPPSRCPVTGRSFFMYIKNPDGEYVATYGGPKDSYTLAVKVDDRDDPHAYSCERYDHDEGAWTETETISMAPEEKE